MKHRSKNFQKPGVDHHRMRLLVSLLFTVALISAREVDISQLKLVNQSGISYYASIGNYDWCIGEERHVFSTLKNVIDNAHKKRASKNSLCTMVDVGMNDGFYTNMAASLGCSVWSFELQEQCISMSMNALVHNKVESQVTIIDRPVSNVHNAPISIMYSKSANCSGNFNLGRGDCPTCYAPKEKDRTEKAFTTISLSHFFPPHFVIDFLKIDTEGFDPQVLEGSESLFRDRRIKVAVVEGQAKMWTKLNKGETNHEEIYKKILGYGYSIECLKASNRDVSAQTWPIYDTQNVDAFISKLLASECIDWKVFHAKR